MTDEQEREVIALYLGGTLLETIKAKYDVTNGFMYSMLNRHHVARRRPQTAAALAEEPTLTAPEIPVTAPETFDADKRVVRELRMPNALRVTADANGFVQSVEPRLKMYIWEVRFESALRVQAPTISEAISEVQKQPEVRRVFNVALKGGL
jgi:hypothetical protein